EEDFEAYLKYYREGGRAAQNADNGRRGGAAGSRRGRGGQGQRGRGRRGQGRRGQGQRGQGRRGERGRGDQQQRQAQVETEQSGADQAPARPRWPAAIKPNPAQEALLRVVQGEVPLRIEAHRVDEIRAALALATAKRLPGITLEFGSEAGEIAEEIAAAGAPVIITDLLSGNAASYEKGRDGTLPGVLHRAGVPVAIASGSLKNSRNLTLMAAFACGQGLPEDAAIRAITLTPAEILGIADQVGSLEKDKVADVLITSGPLLQSDTRILRVVSRSRTWHEVK
ncbi:MAG: hypothetical protein CMJ89_20895, partial [Planctomycetes bacterium]|nr:hypothetical protein [Planctomycetota bacterium]